MRGEGRGETFPPSETTHKTMTSAETEQHQPLRYRSNRSELWIEEGRSECQREEPCRHALDVKRVERKNAWHPETWVEYEYVLPSQVVIESNGEAVGYCTGCLLEAVYGPRDVEERPDADD